MKALKNALTSISLGDIVDSKLYRYLIYLMPIAGGTFHGRDDTKIDF